MSDQIEQAFVRLLESYEQLEKHLNTDDSVSMDFIEKKLDEQSAIFKSVEENEAARRDFKNRNEERYEELVSSLKEKRETVENKIESIMNSMKKNLEATDQSLELMDHYKPSEADNYYFDQTI
jgi:(p)ppGpp synthase/HD superfamily hydrolase